MAEKPYKPKSVKTRSRAGKVANQPIARTETHSASFGAFLLENFFTFPIQEPEKFVKNRRFYAIAGTYSASFEVFLSENRTTFPIQEQKKICKKQEVL